MTYAVNELPEVVRKATNIICPRCGESRLGVDCITSEESRDAGSTSFGHEHKYIFHIICRMWPLCSFEHDYVLEHDECLCCNGFLEWVQKHR